MPTQEGLKIPLIFTPATSAKDLKKIYEYTIDAFSDTPDFSWKLEDLKAEMKDGWEIFGATNDEEDIVAAAFTKIDGDTLYTKNTGLKIHHQGSGYSHQIKEFFEHMARKLKLKYIVHYCRIDNFRMYSLNESHGYVKTDNKSADGQVVEWRKKL
ncbi:MAG: hypothetical protein COW00_10045 [Bdellovibrio sp. CG12_big_fil_rev_8_21_14_0_65_39_13]|nr:MAG: hypothetical protein COW78_01270 [Bdellovibrio sp. CG22_combo_CG10-13_8_21_14_all_39_27]PIQ59452.1 MAG: hypothetical protein COW00_10045 [Bdellovibrio sp. CG12_big_fil_rev_8_21_14_0_65_39_13]PIR36582.1 MAG: hypothetical protein COV37_02775 [Bdellovibrio sp. CG11_big_fil_rev_8_21_14_0_20_39_38]